MTDSFSDDTRTTLLAVLSALLSQAKIYLFGSRARGTYRITSDIDIAIDADEKRCYTII